MGELQMILRSLLLSAFVLLSGIIGGAPRSFAATDDPASFVNDLGTRALAAMRNGDAVPQQMIDDPLEGRAVLFETRLLCSDERYSHHFGISEERQRVVNRAHRLPGSV